MRFAVVSGGAPQLRWVDEHDAADRIGPIPHSTCTAHDAKLVGDERIDLRRVIEPPFLRPMPNVIDEDQQAATELTANDRLCDATGRAQLRNAGHFSK